MNDMGTYIFRGVITFISLIGALTTLLLFVPETWTKESIGYWALLAGGWIIAFIYSLLLSKKHHSSEEIKKESQKLANDVKWLRAEFSRANISLEYATSVISNNDQAARPIKRRNNTEAREGTDNEL